MKTRCWSYLLLSFFVLTIFPSLSFANHESPAVFVKGVIDQCLDILKSVTDKNVQKEKILNLMRDSFDFPEITEVLLRGLEVADSEKSAFTDLFPMLLQMRYNIFVKSPDNLTVEYSRYEVSGDETRATVYTRTKIPPHDFALNYKLRHIDGEWKIQDITVDGISLIGNYRAQIRKVLMFKPFSEFLSDLAKKIKQNSLH